MGQCHRLHLYTPVKEYCPNPSQTFSSPGQFGTREAGAPGEGSWCGSWGAESQSRTGPPGASSPEAGQRLPASRSPSRASGPGLRGQRREAAGSHASVQAAGPVVSVPHRPRTGVGAQTWGWDGSGGVCETPTAAPPTGHQQPEPRPPSPGPRLPPPPGKWVGCPVVRPTPGVGAVSCFSDISEEL